MSGNGWRVHVEAETRIVDARALRRRLALKVRDGGSGHLVLVVAKTRRNRDALAAMATMLEDLLPIDSRTIVRALQAGRDPKGNGIVIL